MKLSIYLGLLGATIVPARVWAQPVPTPPTFIADEKTVLTPDFVREADVILVARLSPDKRAAGVARAAQTGYELIRGDRFSVGRGLVVPSGETIENNAPLALVFARIDPVSQQPILLARLAATPENIERARQLASENQKITVTFSTDKTSYAPDDAIILKWQARNTSPTVQKIYVGQYALQHTAIYGGSGTGTGTGGSHNRAESDYVTLAPGEVWSDTRTIRGPFPQGEVRLEMTLDSSDNFLGSESKSRRAEDRAAQKRVEGVALFKASGELSVAIEPPSPAARQALIERLSSPIWSENLAAAVTLSQLEDAAQIPQMRALAAHPWSALRIRAAVALAKPGVAFGPELRALVFDPDRRVRSETLEAIYKNNVEGAGLSALAMMAVEQQAIERGILLEKDKTRNAEYAITRARDSNRNLGDLLAARIEAGKAEADGINAPYLLNLLAENQRNTRLSSENSGTPAERQEVLNAWKTAAPNLKVAGAKDANAADLEREIAVARARMFDNFEVGPQFDEIADNLRQIVAKGPQFPRADNPSRVFLEKLAPAARLDILRALQWQAGRTLNPLEDDTALKLVAQIEGPNQSEARDYLLGQLYGGIARDSRLNIYVSDDVAYSAAVALGEHDFAFARPHLEAALQSDQPKIAVGAATGLMLGGQKSALPAIFDDKNAKGLEWLPFEDIERGLEKATGLKFKNRTEWEKWWAETGSKTEWK